MSADVLRAAANAIRADYSDRREAAFENAVADWFDQVARRDENGGMIPDWSSALTAARAFLDESA